MNSSMSPVDLIREAFYYKSRFEDSTMVFKIDYPVTEDPSFPYLVKDLALLAQSGFRIVIVPGAKESIDKVLLQHGLDSTYGRSGDLREPARVTSAEVMPFVEMAAFHVATRYMTFLSGSRVDAVIGNFVRARGLGVIDGTDMGHTGTVDKIYADSISRVLKLGMVPILPCIGWSPSGRPYNVPSDEIALEASSALGAIKLFIVSLRGKINREMFSLPDHVETRDDGSVVRLTPQEAEAMIASLATPAGAQADGTGCLPQAMRRLALGLQACRAGVDRVHIIDGTEEGAILKELFSNLGAGTMIYADQYESIRPLHSRDLPDILRLMEPLMRSDMLIRRTAEDIQQKKDDYSVFEIDGSVHACGALHDWGEGQGELAAVAADPFYSGMNLGSRMVGYLIAKARKSGMGRVFVLTTQTQDWFESLGFSEAPVDSLPQQRLQTYDHQRKSKVFALELG